MQHNSFYASVINSAESCETAILEAGIVKKCKRPYIQTLICNVLLENGYDLRTVQKFLGYSDVRTTKIYIHVLDRGAKEVESPLDGILDGNRIRQ